MRARFVLASAIAAALLAAPVAANATKPSPPPPLPKPVSYPVGYGTCTGTTLATTCVNTVPVTTSSAPVDTAWVVCLESGLYSPVVSATTVTDTTTTTVTTTYWKLVKKAWVQTQPATQTVSSTSTPEQPVAQTTCTTPASGPFTSLSDATQSASTLNSNAAPQLPADPLGNWDGPCSWDGSTYLTCQATITTNNTYDTWDGGWDVCYGGGVFSTSKTSYDNVTDWYQTTYVDYYTLSAGAWVFDHEDAQSPFLYETDVNYSFTACSPGSVDSGPYDTQADADAMAAYDNSLG